MPNGNYSYEHISIIEPEFGSNLTDLIIELDFLRKKKLTGSTHPYIFFQLKRLFHLLESIGSARIEGNHTTIAEYIETKIEGKKKKPPKIEEISNIEDTMNFIEESVDGNPINNMFIRELHKRVVSNLPTTDEGDQTPGEYRRQNIRISHADHVPPDYTQVNDYMQELIEFMDRNDRPKYDLLKIALSHHRFVWVHPFTNGNGRTVRLLTYAQLVKSGFNVAVGRIINPTAIFCGDREKYYNFLSEADSGDPRKLLGWCEYVLRGLKVEIEKIDRILNYNYLSENILMPAIDYSLDRKIITKTESEILRIAVKKVTFQAQDIKHLFPGKSPIYISRVISRLREKKMITPEEENGRKYLIKFSNNYLLRGVVRCLDKCGFLPLQGEAE